MASWKLNPLPKVRVIQENAVLAALRSKRSYNEVKDIANKVTNPKQISNGKVKQRKQQAPHGIGFQATCEYKSPTLTST